MKKVIVFTCILMLLSGMFSKITASLGGDMRLVLIGYVVDGQDTENKEPAEGVTVELVYMDNSNTPTRESNVTDADGSFYYRLESDKEYRVYTLDENGEPYGAQTVSTFGKDDPEVLYVMLEAPPSEKLFTSTANFNYNESKSTGSATYDNTAAGFARPANDKGLSFKIQLGAFEGMSLGNFDCLSGFAGNVDVETSGKLYRHLYGNFASYRQVRNSLEQISSQGCFDAYIVPYLDGKRLDMSAHRAYNLYGGPAN